MRRVLCASLLAGTFLLATPAAEAQFPGVVAGSFYSQANQKNIPFNIYLPPNYATSGDYYPVVYWLHGALQNQNSGRTVTTYLHNAIVAGQLPPMIVVLGTDSFSGSTGYKDWPQRNQYGEQAILELIAHTDATYRTLPFREYRAMEGFSLGGLGTMYFASKYVDMFCSAVTSGGALADDDSYFYTYYYAKFLAANTAFRLCIGSNDNLCKTQNENFSYWLSYLNIPHDYEVVSGAIHSIPSYYQRLGASTLAFHAAKFYGR
jgi:enterochelin esterase-like enzyme